VNPSIQDGDHEERRLVDAHQEGQGQENYVEHVLEVGMRLCPREPK